jgi:tetratricopeptide (TPR) repeat protein
MTADDGDDYLDVISSALEAAAAGHHEEAIAAVKVAATEMNLAPRQQARLYRNAGIVAENAGIPEVAVGYYEQAAAVQDAGAVAKGIASVHLSLHRLYGQMGRSDLAEQHLGTCIEKARRTNDERVLAVLSWLGALSDRETGQ